MELGAKREDVAALAIKDEMILVLLGGPIGLAAAIAVTSLLGSWMFQIGTADPPTFIVVISILTCIALLSSCIPAMKATKVDPITVLRCEDWSLGSHGQPSCWPWVFAQLPPPQTGRDGGFSPGLSQSTADSLTENPRVLHR